MEKSNSEPLTNSSTPYNVRPIQEFEKKAERLIKKYPSLAKELRTLRQSLAKNPVQSKSLGLNCYKVRLAITSKHKGKSGGARVITYIAVLQHEVVLLTIYDKSEQETVHREKLLELLETI